MKFDRLKLHGFKSFCDHTELVMEPGLTGIVGPNGCGKSNLVEAMRWVMGESSYKAMRASGMDEVIFSGAANRPGRNTAEVTLVLDNSDRTAPAALNHSDILEVTRRIEREAGSVYRVNGKEVRARDVQLLFADASTGAHSPALVRQGQIGELIAAKPVQRRALLEEAAGISGLHSRRHEAELRLRAAEQNLERVDDIVGQIAQQLETLKRQARLAVRYRALSGDIRRTEAMLYHIRWVGTRAAEKETEADQARLIRDLADATHLERVAQAKLDAADAALQPLRNSETSSGAALQRLIIMAEQLTDEARRNEQRRSEFENRLRQLAADGLRERELISESETTLAGYGEEATRLSGDSAVAQAEFDTARKAVETARAEVVLAENDARQAADGLAEVRARRAQSMRAVDEATQRVSRLTRQLEELSIESEDIASKLDANDNVIAKRAALEAARAAAVEAELQALDAEALTGLAQSKLDAALPKLQDIEAALTRLEAEAATLAKMLNVGQSLWPAIVDQLKVEPGFETALGAALGDDLEASADTGAPFHWSAALDGSDDPALPQGAERLSRHVEGSDLLIRRLNQVGLVGSTVGPELMRALKPGQILVTLEGDVWRWDGFVSAADAPSPAAQRLAQRNRLAELDDAIARMRGERNGWKHTFEDLRASLDAARAEEKESRERWRNAQHDISASQAEVDKAQRTVGDLATRQYALNEAQARLNSELIEATASKIDADRLLASVGDETDAAAQANEKQASLAQTRGAADQARAKLNAIEAAATVRTERMDQIGRDRIAWERRLDGALRQLETLALRETEIRAQLTGLDASPESFASRQAVLDQQIEDAKITHKAATDSLAYAQTGLREATSGLKSASDVLAVARVELGRVEERLRGAITHRQQIEQQVVEVLGIHADQTLQAAGLRPMEALPAEQPTAQRVERLKSERERLGGVNLSAEKEADETQTRLDTLTKDRDDLIEAIAKLRQGIQALNREGRARLSEAFETVNGHFRSLFTTLFGGGTAELSFVESDDPLEAGLEIIAMPPGKKPQTMTLLSGGEQALTALSLIFAVFLTNPAPICVLDEVDAPLDDANVERFCDLLDGMRQRTDTRFLVVTHNPITMSRVDRLFGVTQAERGVSQLVSVDLQTAESFREAV